MRLRNLARFGLVLVVAVATAGVTLAFAQTSTTQTAPSAAATDTVKPAPLAEGVYQVQVAPEPTAGQGAVIVAVQLPPATKLPAMVRIPVPVGAVPTWAGEILGGDATLDPARPYRTVQGTGGQVLEMTLEETRSAQAEFLVGAQSGTDGSITMNVNWVQASASERTEFSVRLPAGSSQGQITPTPEGAPVTNAIGETLYTLPTLTMQLGQIQPIVVKFVAGGQQGQPTGAQSTGATVLWLLGAAFVVVVAILLFSLMTRRKQA